MRQVKSLKHALVMTLTAALLALAPISRAMPPRDLISTNTTAAQGSSNFSLALPESDSGQPTACSTVKMWLFYLQWDIRDYARYAFPYLVENEPQALLVPALCLLALAAITSGLFAGGFPLARLRRHRREADR